MKSLVYLPPFWWLQYSIGAYVALVRLATSIPVPEKDENSEQ
jgi:hypothetical protein